MDSIEKFKPHLWSLVLKHCDILSILQLARTSKTMYYIVEDYFKLERKKYKIPQDILSYHNNIHYMCEEFMCKRCFKCGTFLNLFYYKYNWNLKICGLCFPPSLSVIRFQPRDNEEVIDERKVKGFTKRELRKFLIHRVTYSPPTTRNYYKREIEQLTYNRYGFKHYRDYQNFISRRFRIINEYIINSNEEKIGLKDNIFVKYIKYKKSNSGIIYKFNDKEAKMYKRKCIQAKARYEVCKSILLDNQAKYLYIVDNLEGKVGSDRIQQFIKGKYNCTTIFDMKSIMFIEDLDFHNFFNDGIFKYFKKYYFNEDNVIKKIISLI